ncbi:MAG: FtsW/RodA/SpoVE family cell cycle protein, partial [Treponema sp.]|nr:FtsW/RodA/SpoVE family cell cycle protein [Treponema sp.]
MKLKIFEKFDYLLMICVLFLGVLGILFLYSAGVNSDGVLESYEYKRQIIWVSIGFSLMCLLAMLDYRKYERYALAGYVAMIVILLYVRLFGKTVKGAKS